MKIKIFSILLSVAVISELDGKDIDIESYVKKYWTVYHNRKIEIGSGNKNWPVTPELKEERLEYFTQALKHFAPHHVKEAETIDKAFGWKQGTYLGLLRFGEKTGDNIQEKRNPAHECTSWITMDNLSGGKSIIMHKNRDSRKKLLTIQRRAVPGKHAWIGSGFFASFYPAQGINDRGLVVMMNSGDPLPEAENSQYGLGTTIICRILLEECATAKEAVAMLQKILNDNAYTHAGSGSIWFIGDAENVYIMENSARKHVVKPVESGFIARGNSFHYPEMQACSLNSYQTLVSLSRREFTVRDYLINKQWRLNGIITPLDNAAASRISKIEDAPECYPPSGQATISSTTFVIDKEYPEYLSTVYLTLSSPNSSTYLPVPLTLQNIPEEILNGSFSKYSFDLFASKKSIMPEKELSALERRTYERHSAAIEKARILLRTRKDHSIKTDVAKILNRAFEDNFNDIRNTVKKHSTAGKK